MKAIQVRAEQRQTVWRRLKKDVGKYRTSFFYFDDALYGAKRIDERVALNTDVHTTPSRL